ncbi:MAG: 2-hydroxyacid dehydrogenase [Opitutaceae bacterium]|nr:2-hydroxyacid dehydrogenase [Opitutaceae bacterium]
MPVVTFYDTKPYDREYIGAMLANATGVELRLLEFRLTEASVETARGSAAVCLFVNDRADRAILAKLAAMGVKHIALRCAGFNNVDLLAAREVGIAVTRVPAYSPHAVAEHTIALLLTLNRKIHRAYNRVREHNFALAGLVGFDLHGKTVGIVGTGKIGRIVAQIFRGFDTRVLACDVAPDGAWAMTHGIGYTSLHELLAQSDIVSLHTPLTTATHHLINADTLALMKRGAYLVNTSRGKLVETAALIKALKSRQLGGVALDVYEEEEGVFFEDLSGVVLQDDELSRLLTFPNVLVTSHQAFLTAEALREIAFATVENLQRGFRGADFLPGTNLT